MKKIFYCFVLFFVLCAFNRAEYKVETLKSNDGMSVMVYIPKNFCRYEELEIVNNTISKITGINSNNSNNLYSYRNCEEDKLFKEGKTDDIKESLTIIVPKQSIMPQVDEKSILEIIAKNIHLIDEAIAKTTKENIGKINVDEEIKNKDLNENEKKYLYNTVEDLKTLYFNIDLLNTKLIDNNIITSFVLEDDKNHEYMNSFSGFVNGILIDISYSSEDKNKYLSDNKNFIKYIQEIRELNKAPINFYSEKDNEIINIKFPDYGNYRDITNVFKRNKISSGYSRVLSEYNIGVNDSSQVFLGIIVNPTNLDFFAQPTAANTEEQFKKLGTQADTLNIFNSTNSNTEKESSDTLNKQYANKNYVRFAATVNGQKVVYHYYLIKLKNQNVIVCASLINKRDDFNEKDDERIKNAAEEYIKYLQKINKN